MMKIFLRLYMLRQAISVISKNDQCEFDKMLVCHPTKTDPAYEHNVQFLLPKPHDFHCSRSIGSTATDISPVAANNKCPKFRIFLKDGFLYFTTSEAKFDPQAIYQIPPFENHWFVRADIHFEEKIWKFKKILLDVTVKNLFLPQQFLQQVDTKQTYKFCVVFAKKKVCFDLPQNFITKTDSEEEVVFGKYILDDLGVEFKKNDGIFAVTFKTKK